MDEATKVRTNIPLSLDGRGDDDPNKQPPLPWIGEGWGDSADPMIWQQEYRNRLATAEEAVAIVEDGDRVMVPLSEQPMTLLRALSARANEIKGATLTVSVPQFDIGPFLDAGWNVDVENFIGPFGRPYENAGRAPYSPLAFSLSFKAPDERPKEAKPIDVALVTVAPPNRQGQITFGPQSWYKRGFAQRARKVAAEVNPLLIRTYGDGFMPLAEIDKMIEVEPSSLTRKALLRAASDLPGERRQSLEEIIGRVGPNRLAPYVPHFATIDVARLKRQLGIDEPSLATRAIGENVKRLIPDGSTIQIGVGTPSSYMPRLGVFDDKIDLGLHSELTVPGVGKLVGAGVINGSRKTIHRGRAVATSWSGANDEDLAIIDDNPIFELYSPEHVLNPWVIAQNYHQVGINNALYVDLRGQIASESLFGGQMYNGIGGQPETHLGALYSEGGRAITLLYSTAMEGAVSRIVPRLESGEIVTIPHFWSDTVVTEYGVAHLLGKNHRERAEALIAIAHPDFRAELRKAATGWLFA